jgi:hypothetical protein
VRHCGRDTELKNESGDTMAVTEGEGVRRLVSVRIRFGPATEQTPSTIDLGVQDRIVASLVKSGVLAGEPTKTVGDGEMRMLFDTHHESKALAAIGTAMERCARGLEYSINCSNRPGELTALD